MRCVIPLGTHRMRTALYYPSTTDLLSAVPLPTLRVGRR
jgi:hypothetical protein